MDVLQIECIFSMQWKENGLGIDSVMSPLWWWWCSVVSNSLRTHGLLLGRFLSPWDFPGRILEWVVISYSGDLPNLGIELTCLASPTLTGRFFTTVLPGKPTYFKTKVFNYLGTQIQNKNLLIMCIWVLTQLVLCFSFGDIFEEKFTT